MPGNPHPVETTIIDGLNVLKASERSYAKTRNRLYVTSATEIRNTDLSGQFAGLDLLGAPYRLDTTDTTTPDDGATCIIDAAGNRFFQISTPAANANFFETRTAAAAASVPSATNCLLTAGYSTRGDLGAALYVKTGGSTPGGFQSADGAWWKIAERTVAPQMFGAKGDGTTVDATAFAAALSSGRPVVAPYVSAGYNLGATPIDIPANGSLIGSNRVLLKSTSATYAIGLNGNNVRVGGFSIDMTGSGASSSAIRYRTASQVVNISRISDIYFSNCVHAVDDETSASNYIVDVRWEDLYSQFTRGTQFMSSRSRGFFLIDACAADHTLNTSAVTWRGFDMLDFIGLEMNRCDVLGPVPSRVTPAYQANAEGIRLLGSPGNASVWMDRCLIDSTMADGMLIKGFVYFNAKNIETFATLGTGITIESVSAADIVNCFTSGARGLAGVLSTQDGLVVKSSSSINISNIYTQVANRDGVSVQDTGGSNFSVINCNQNGRWGWFESGTSNVNVKTNGNLSGNNQIGSGGSLTQVGAFSAFGHYIPTSGAFLTTTGPATIA